MTTALLAIKPPYTMRERWLAAYRDWRRGRRDLEPGQTPAQLALMTIQRIGRIGAIPTDVMDVRVRTPIGRKPAWWQVAGKTCVAAYQPKGAASLAASYVNLANPGTYDAAPGVAPTLTADGWTFDGTTQYLTTGIVPGTGWTMIVRVNQNGGQNVQLIAGASETNANGFALRLIVASLQAVYVHGSGWSADVVSLSGIHAIAKQQGYYNGIPTASGGSGTLSTTRGIFIGQQNVAGSIYDPYFFSGSMDALAIYSDTLTAGEVAAVSAAMAAL